MFEGVGLRFEAFPGGIHVDVQIVQAMVGVLEAKDLSTAAHTWRVVLYTRVLAQKAGVTADVLHRLTHAAALHDVGKIEIPEEILQKPGPLTAAEYEVMKTHAPLGHERLVRMQEEDPILLHLVRHHHERFDGLGYPDKLAGADIPAVARYFAVVDSFDALTSHRHYRHDVGEDAARRALVELQAGAGTRYDPDAVALFTDLYHEGRVEPILRRFGDKSDIPTHDQLDRVHDFGAKLLEG